MNVETVTGALGTVEATSVIALSSHSIDAQTVSPPIPLEKRWVSFVVDDPQKRKLILKTLLEIKTRILWAATHIRTLFTLLRLCTGCTGGIVLQPLASQSDRGLCLQPLPLRCQFMPLQLQ